MKYAKKIYTGRPPYPQIQLSAVYRGLKKVWKNQRNKQFISFKTRAKRERAITWCNPAAQMCPALDSSSFVPVAHFPAKSGTS
jgi:hypothetical protein